MSPQAAMRKTERKSAMDIEWFLPSTTYHPPPFSVHCRRDNDTHPNRHRAHQYSQRDVLVFDDLFPQMIGRHLVDDGERYHENENAQHGVQDRIQQIAGMEISHVLLSSDISGIAAIGRSIRAGVIADRLGNHFLLVDLGERPAAIFGHARKTKQ